MIYVTEFFLEWQIFQTKIVEKVKTYVIFNNFFFRKWCHLCDNVEKYGTAKQAIDDNMIELMFFACRVYKARIQIHTHNV